VSHTFTRTKAYEQYLNELSKTDFRNQANKIPIIILSVNPVTKKILFGFQVVWHHAKATVYRNVKFRELTYRSWGIALDNILSMDDVIRVISSPNIKVIKHLRLSKNVDGIYYFADLLYLRSLRPDYRMADKEVVNQTEKFNRFLFDIPENEYPSDKLDDWIEGMISKVCVIEKKKSDLLLFTTELRDLQIYKNTYIKINKPLIFELENYDAISLPEESIVSLAFNIELFVTDTMSQNAFSFEISPMLFSWNEWLLKYSEIKQKIESYSVLSTIFE
jgi:hypothetical protein